jgi:diguanylate cyclase (GGDEF)-like protein
LVNILITLYLFRKYSRKRNSIRLVVQDLQEKINILSDQNYREARNKSLLMEKIKRYDNLKKIIEEINQNLTLEATTDTLASIALSVISKNRGTCILYLVDNLTQKLKLVKTKKEDNKLIVKAKEGDIFDFWLLRHTTPLFIEDIKRDFRFDPEQLKSRDVRPISSLVSSLFMSENKVLGILRLDNRSPGFYSQDDLRFLVTLCDLGAVAIENGELFQKTQDLAIHDGLTGLYTKGYFLERLKEECKRAIRQTTVLSLLMLDIDYFKHYNDKFGHTAGDIVLKELSHNLIKFLGDSRPIISRFGGEEFCIILPRLKKQQAYAIAEELKAMVERMKIILRNQVTKVTVSVGLASFPDNARDEDELLFKADQAMYSAKQKGRNRVCGL